MRSLLMTLCFVSMLFSTAVSAKIVFQSKRDGVVGIYIMEDDGSNVKLLTDVLKPGLPRWSPDGKQIVFERWTSPHNSQDHNIYVMNADGTDIRELTDPADAKLDGYPTFSPDGKSIVFSRYAPIQPPNPVPNNWNWENGNNICILDLESGKIEAISDLSVSFLDWSPDGKRMVFNGTPTFGESGSNIWIMDVDGGRPRELLPKPPAGVSRYRPRWSADGKKILYYHIQTQFRVIDGKRHLIPLEYRFFIYDLRVRQSRQLRIPKKWRIAGLDWMDKDKAVIITAVEIKLNALPDGKPYLYNIYKYNIWTHKITRLTDHPGQDLGVDWISDQAHAVSPIGKKHKRWGQLKQALQVHRAVYNTISQSMFHFLKLYLM